MSSPSISRSTTQSNTSEDSRRATVSPPRDVTGLVSKEGEHPFSCGAFGDVYKGTWRESRFSLSKKTVAIKVIRPFLAEGKEREKFARRLNREIGIWQKLTHDNILPFIGIATNFGKLPSPISLWMPNGTVTRYLRTRREVNRLSFLLGIAEGLSYLHNNDPQIIHGDLKADNILVSELGTPCLADFGLSRVLDDDPFWKTNASTASGTYRWMSPELLRGQQDLSVESDVYAYAMTSLEIMTGNVPFGNIRQEAVINLVANEDRRPERPDNAEITDEIWSLWEMCWQTDPSVRPEMLEVLEVVKHFEARPRPLRLLSIDGGGVRVVCALHMLKSMMEKIGSDAKPCEYFDMIAGSGTGGVVALMLGRLRLSADECLARMEPMFKRLYDRSPAKQDKYLKKHKSRFDSVANNEIFDDMIQAVRPDCKMLLNKEKHVCRSFVIVDIPDEPDSPQRIRSYQHGGESWKYRTCAAMTSTVTTPTVFDWIYVAGSSLTKYHNSILRRTNPSTELIQEARSVFGEDRAIGCLISLGLGISSKSLAWDSPLVVGADDWLAGVLRDTAQGIEEVHQETITLLEPGKYFRFDPVDSVSLLETQDWKDIVFWERWNKLDILGDRVKDYMNDPETVKIVSECIKRVLLQTT